MVKTRKVFGHLKLDTPSIRELVLHAENTQRLYRIQEAWEKNFAMKMRRGIFKRNLALKGIANNFIPMVTRDYKKEYGGIGPTLTLADKRRVASKLLPSIIEGAKYKLKQMKPLRKKKR
jgi:hypothetical protein